jgi:hypothetical protein
MLGADGLAWRKGPRSGVTRYDAIRRVRLSYRPMTMQNYRFLAEIWPESGPKLEAASTSWKSLVEHQRLDADYRSFVTELSRRIGAAGGQASFEIGSPPVLYWPGTLVLAGAALALVALVARALQVEAWGGAAFVAGFLALFLWQAGNFFYRNRPGTYPADAVPPQVLPKA